jgi:hypothetical protein
MKKLQQKMPNTDQSHCQLGKNLLAKMYIMPLFFKFNIFVLAGLITCTYESYYGLICEASVAIKAKSSFSQRQSQYSLLCQYLSFCCCVFFVCDFKSDMRGHLLAEPSNFLYASSLMWENQTIPTNNC